MATLYGNGLSPFVRKVRVVLAEKNVAYEHDPVVPFNVSAEYKAISPLGKIPAYRDEKGALPDSSVISAYLEKRHPTPALYPSDPYEYARALWFEEYADSAIVAVSGAKIFFARVVGPRFLNQPADEAAITQGHQRGPAAALRLPREPADGRLARGQSVLDRRRRGRHAVREHAARRRQRRHRPLAEALALRGTGPRAAVVQEAHRRGSRRARAHGLTVVARAPAGRVDPCPPARTAMVDLPTLWHFRLSHYNEKARWALDWKRLPHRRRALLPGPHLPVVWWMTGQKAVPVLWLDGEVISDSTRIIAALETRRPYPAPLSRRPDRTGPGARPRGFLRRGARPAHPARVLLPSAAGSRHGERNPHRRRAGALAPALSRGVSTGARGHACRHGHRRRAQRTRAAPWSTRR